MFDLRERKPKYTHVISSNDVDDWSRLIHDVAMDNEHLMADDRDGDYYFLIRFSPFYRDTTSAEELKLYLDGDKEENEYPFKEWNARGANPYDHDFDTYVQWLSLLRHIQANTPPGMHYDGILAIDKSH